MSICAETSFSKSFNKNARLKFPFFVNKSELETYAGTGVMLGGLGPWFSGVLLLSIFFLIFLLFKLKSKQRNILLISLSFLFFTIMINPMNWWFRFVPQFWLIPCLVVFYLLKQGNRLSTAIRYILPTVMFINLFLMSGYVIFQISHTNHINKTLASWKGPEKLEIYFGQHELSSKQRLQKFNLPYQKVKK